MLLMARGYGFGAALVIATDSKERLWHYEMSACDEAIQACGSTTENMRMPSRSECLEFRRYPCMVGQPRVRQFFHAIRRKIEPPEQAHARVAWKVKYTFNQQQSA